MDPLTISLHACSSQIIPHMSHDQCTATIQYGNAQYTITITKQNDSPATLLGKRTYSTYSPVEEDYAVKECRSNSYNGDVNDVNDVNDVSDKDISLYPDFGHNFQ